MLPDRVGRMSVAVPLSRQESGDPGTEGWDLVLGASGHCSENSSPFTATEVDYVQEERQTWMGYERYRKSSAFCCFLNEIGSHILS